LTAQTLRVGRLGAGDLVRIGAGGLTSRRLRSGLTAIGIAIGIAAMVAVLGISEASRASLLSVLDRLGTNLLTVTPGQTFGGDTATLPDDAAAMIRRIGPIDAVSATASTGAAVRRNDHISKSETGGIAVIAADTSLLDTLGGSVARGRFLDAATERYPTVVLGSVAARRLGIVDLDAPIQVWLGGQWFTVIGILDSMPLTPEFDRAAIIGWDAAETYLDLDLSPTTLYVKPTPAAVADVRSVLAQTSNPEHPEEIRISRPSDALEARAAAATTFTGLFLGLGAVALLVGGLGIANVMLMSVLERRSEIGLRRALGATREHVAGQFLAEAVLLAGTGGAIGVIVGSAIAAVYARSQGWPPVVPPIGIAGGIGGAILIGAVAGLYPALRAASVPPTEALRGT
jgi:ABC-type antimicrobial peptide transport system permease subunit